MSRIVAKLAKAPIVVETLGTTNVGWAELRVVSGVGAEVIPTTYLKIDAAGVYRVTYVSPVDVTFDRQRRWVPDRETISTSGGIYTEHLVIPVATYQHIRLTGELPGLRIILERLT